MNKMKLPITKKTIITIAALSVITNTSQASFKDKLYADLYGGASFLDSTDIMQGSMNSSADFDTSVMFGAKIGYQHDVNWAFELEYTYRRNDLGSISGGAFGSATDGDYASTAVMLNTVYTFDSVAKNIAGFEWKPYAGFGIGVLTEADIDFTISEVETEYDKNFIPAAQLILGSEFSMNQNWSFFGELRYTFAGSVDLKSSNGATNVSLDYSGASALIGLRYRF